jgi:hypothetical protein
VDAILERAEQLKQESIDFVYDAEGELAVAFEKYVADFGSRETQDIRQQNLVIDSFLLEGKIGDKTPLKLFLEEQANLAPSDRALLDNWQHSFIGLFEIAQLFPGGVELINWLTSKRYKVMIGKRIPTNESERWQVGDILITRIAPVSLRSPEWMFLSDILRKGKLSKPKLAVAIGEFKKNYPQHLYSDAPDLLEQAWESVAQYHHEFVDFFGSDRVTLPGYQLNQKINELQSLISKKRLAAAGIDDSKSVREILQESGADEAEIEAATAELGADSNLVAKAIDSNTKISMTMPKVNLPDEIKKAQSVTSFSHPRWGQMLLPTYNKFQAMLEAEDLLNFPNYELLVRKYLEDPQINYFIWQQLQQQYPDRLEKALQLFLKRPELSLQRDLESIMLEFKKPLQPELPEIASVPQHLHDLFEEALAQVQKSKAKDKKVTKKTKGFGAQS